MIEILNKSYRNIYKESFRNMYYKKRGKMVEILDSTLREGEQTPGVSFTIEQKVKIAKLLDKFGVDYIEAGHPIASTPIKKAVKKIASLNLNAKILGHARALKEDIDAVAECGCEWVGIFKGCSNLSLKYKFHETREQYLKSISEAIRYAKSKGLKVRFTPEDATRTEKEFLIKVIKTAKEAGADRVSIADTVGCMTPSAMYKLVSEIKKRVNIDLHVHCHNDFGMAAANSLAAYEAGVKVIDVSINGLGERTGIASLPEIIMSLKLLYDVKKKWKLEMLPKLSETVEKYSRLQESARTPIIGKNAFTHMAGLHSSAVLLNPKCYEAIPPYLVGKKTKIYIDHLASRAAVKHALKKMGLPITEKKINEVLYSLKEKREKKWVMEIEM